MLRRAASAWHPWSRQCAPTSHHFRSFSSLPALCRQSAEAPPIFRAQNTAVYPFGVPSNDPEHALFRDLTLTIGDSDAWAILSPSSSSPTRAALLATIQHHVRFDPHSSAGHPILAVLPPVARPAEQGGPRDRTVDDLLQFVSFKTRLGRSGEFDDYTARYYSIRDEDKLTVRDHLREATGAESHEIEEKAKLLRMESFLDLPLITLSNGQTRRARILRALLAKPELLILEEPFTGLDVASRDLLVTLLSNLHAARSPRVLLVLRPQDPLPSFVTHLALADATPSSASPSPTSAATARSLALGTRDEILSTSAAQALLSAGERERSLAARRTEARRAAAAEQVASEAGRRKLVEMRGVNVTYGRRSEGQEERRVLKELDWTIREGERWLLAGHNGSGKSTLLALVLGDHPRSFTEDITLFDKPRMQQATATLQEKIGHVSPEIFNAFPRKYGPGALTAYEAIVTGFESVFSYRRATPAQDASIASLLSALDHPLLTPAFLARPFADLTAGEQSLVLLLRALVKRPPLLVLDEPFSGMDKGTIEKVHRLLDEGLDEKQALVLITHFEEEQPKSVVRLLRLENGEVIERI
ncbi:uncharacterized protein JCM10292_004385 [Rhodotorula paludigena]|uniref:uncharacterized protein n=1 Tax=Rhodotorula paludigena TaxID=86838 RepID=UPI0031755058